VPCHYYHCEPIVQACNVSGEVDPSRVHPQAGLGGFLTAGEIARTTRASFTIRPGRCVVFRPEVPLVDKANHMQISTKPAGWLILVLATCQALTVIAGESMRGDGLAHCVDVASEAN